MNYKVTTSKIKIVLSEHDDFDSAEKYCSDNNIDGMINEYDGETRFKHKHYKNGVATHNGWH